MLHLTPAGENRRLAALVFIDVVGFSALAEANEKNARDLLREFRELTRQGIKKHHGHEHDTAGDGFFIEFSSAGDALQFGLELQQNLKDRNLTQLPQKQIQARIGLHVGDVLIHQEGVIGHSVNIAARIQSLAPVGGLCLSQQAVDLIGELAVDLKLKKLKPAHLKNISVPLQVYVVDLSPPAANFNWGRLRKMGLLDWSNSLRYFTAVVALCAFAILVVDILQVFSKGPNVKSEISARTDLSTEWAFRSNSGEWQKYAPSRPWDLMDEMQGRYELRHSFYIHGVPREPALVLGLIPEHSRVFLNGQFLGGSDQLTDLAFYSFDSSLLHRDSANELLVQVKSGPSLNPGVTILPNVGSFLGEFADVRSAVVQNTIRYHIFQSIYLSICGLVWLLSLVFCFASPHNRNYFYVSFYMLLGLLYLAYYSPWVADHFSLEFLRYCKFLAVTSGPFVLLANYFYEFRRHKQEKITNGLLLIWTVGLSLDLFEITRSPTEFLEHGNLILKVAACTSALIWISGLVLNLGPLKGQKGSNRISFANLAMLFGLLNCISLLGAIRENFLLDLFSQNVHSFLFDLSLFTPFLYSVFVLVVMASISFQKHNLLARRKRRDSLIAEVHQLIREHKNPNQVLEQLQQSICTTLEARRSSIYILDSQEKPTEFVLKSMLNQNDAARGVVAETASLTTGLMAYVFANQNSLLIEDVSRDPRLKQVNATFQSSSCMIFPLIEAGSLYGVLTLADKRDNEAFTTEDFVLVSEVQNLVAGLIRSMAEPSRRHLSSVG